MKPNIINVSLNDKFNNFSYPIFIGNGLLSNCEEILKKFVLKRKVILIHDNFFSLKNKITNNLFHLLKQLKNYVNQLI